MADRGSGLRSARRCGATRATSTTPSPSRNCSTSIGRWARARSAKASATSWRPTWTASCPTRSKSLREGAIAPWNSPSYAHELEELLALADDYNLPVDVPYAELTEEQRRLIVEGVPERNFGGLNGFFRWLERRKYKMHLRVFLSRWRSYRPCPACGGARLRPEALAVRVAGKNFADVCRMKIRDALAFFDELQLPEWQQQIAEPLVADVRSRLAYLVDVGVGYLAHRPAAANAQRRRSPARRAHRDARLQPRRHAVRARRTVRRPASGRRRAAGRRDRAAATARQHGRRRRARRGDHSPGRPGRRIRARRRRRRRPRRVSRHADRNWNAEGQPHRRLARRPARRRQRRTRRPPSQGWLKLRGAAATICKTSPSSFRSACCAW